MSLWIEKGINFITPLGLDNPEGHDVKALLKRFVGDHTVLDFGCGRGRLSSAFSPEQYCGYDIGPEQLKQAREANPDHYFTPNLPKDRYQFTLFYTVLLHLDDPLDALAWVDSDRVLIAEIMNPSLAKPNGMPPAFNRSAEQYQDIMRAFGYELIGSIEFPYRHYNGEPFTIQEYCIENSRG